MSDMEVSTIIRDAAETFVNLCEKVQSTQDTVNTLQQENTALKNVLKEVEHSLALNKQESSYELHNQVFLLHEARDEVAVLKQKLAVLEEENRRLRAEREYNRIVVDVHKEIVKGFEEEISSIRTLFKTPDRTPKKMSVPGAPNHKRSRFD